MAKKDKVAIKERNKDRITQLVLSAMEVAKEFIKNPVFASAVTYLILHFVGQLNDGEKYYMHEATLRTLKGLAASYPIFAATRGGNAGVAAGIAAGLAVGIAADRPDMPKSAEERAKEEAYKREIGISWENPNWRDIMQQTQDPYLSETFPSP